MSADDSIGTQVKETFMKLAHSAPSSSLTSSSGEGSGSAEQYSNPVTSRTHPGSDVNREDLRNHGAGKNGPNAEFRQIGKEYEDVRKSGDIKTMHAPAHGVDSHPQ